MKVRIWILAGVIAILGALYALYFTEWIRLEPIGIASQVRVSVIQPRFGRPEITKKVRVTNTIPNKTGVVLRATTIIKTNQARRVGLPQWGKIELPPGGAAIVTFTLDDSYVLTGLRVLDVPADGSAPKVLWQLAGKSVPTKTLLYGRDPVGMKPAKAGVKAEPLVPGAPYRLLLEAGRRRGTHDFKTRPAPLR